MSAQIIVDSACDLPKGIIDKYNIKVLPFNLHIDDRSYKDGRDIQVNEVYEFIKKGIYPKTSQVSPVDIKDTFVEYAQKGLNCIYISFSSKMSSTCQTARIIAEKVQEKYSDTEIKVVDSKAGSIATGIMAYRAALLLEKGFETVAVLDKIRLWAEHIEHLFILDSLKALQIGGRISKSTSIIGDVLRIKPLLYVDDGEIKLLKKFAAQKGLLICFLGILRKRVLILKINLLVLPMLMI
ncbi:MAG TPA: DegV family protein [Halanaerobiales bacterium]|nr:DegV family protein [Halanaerobiales bacterium]